MVTNVDFRNRVCVVNIRPMVEGDISAVLKIEEASFRYPCTVEDYRDWLSCPGCSAACVVAESQEIIVGAMVYDVGIEKAELYTIAVDKDKRRQSIGTQMIECIVDHCLRCGVKMIRATVSVSNLDARRFLEAELFIKIADCPGFFWDPPVEALIMERVLCPTAIPLAAIIPSNLKTDIAANLPECLCERMRIAAGFRRK